MEPVGNSGLSHLSEVIVECGWLSQCLEFLRRGRETKKDDKCAPVAPWFQACPWASHISVICELGITFRSKHDCPGSSAWGQMQEPGFLSRLWGWLHQRAPSGGGGGRGLSAVPRYSAPSVSMCLGPERDSVGKLLPKSLSSSIAPM